MFYRCLRRFYTLLFVFGIYQILISSHGVVLGREELTQTQAADPAYFVRDLIQGCRNIVQLNDRRNYAQLLGNFLNENMNYRTIGSFILGRHWHGLNDEQKNQIGQALGPFIINKYLNYLDAFFQSEDNIEIVDLVYREKLKDYLVRTIIRAPDSSDMFISWRVFLDSDSQEYKVSDIIVHRVSLLLTIRMHLIDFINKNGVQEAIDLMMNRRSYNLNSAN